MFQFRFVTSDLSVANVLEIDRISDNNYTWSFRAVNDCNTKTMLLTEAKVYDNLRNLFNLLYWNTNQYSQFEFTTLGFPQIVVNMSNAFMALPYIEATIYSHIRNTDTAALSQQNEILEAEEAEEAEADEVEEVEDYEEAEADDEADDDADEEADDADEEADEEAENSDSEYADMPPLLCIRSSYTPKRNTEYKCPSLKRTVRNYSQNEVIDEDGPCHNTRSGKSSSLNNSDRVSTHLFFD